jgi:glycosyltransferase involved in cell wall biosynthesis
MIRATDRPISVLHLAAGNLYGGIESFLVTLARLRQLRPGLQPEFAVCFDGRLRQELTATGAAVHHFGPARASRPLTIWRARRRFGRLLRSGGIDVVISHGCWTHALFAPPARSRGRPVVFWAHGLHDGRHWLDRWASRSKPVLALANSQLSRSGVSAVFGEVPSEVVYLPVAAPDVPDRESARREIRAALQAPAETTVLLQVSRMERGKGHELLLKVLSRFRERPDWVCWIAGGAQRPREAVYLEQLKGMAGELGIAPRIRFLGQRSDVPRLLAAADVYCQLNTAPESFGLSFVEALYTGLPVVTTALGGVLEIVDETCGFLVAPANVNGLVAAVDQLIQWPHLRQRLGAAGPARARLLCDPERQMERLELLLAGLIRPASAA